MIRSVLAGCLTAVLLFALCACGLPQQSGSADTVSEAYSASTETPSQTQTQTAAPSAAQRETASETQDASEPQSEAQLRVQWMDDVELEDGAYDTFEAESDPQVQIVFTTDRTVRNVRILSLFAGADDEGNLQFEQSVLHRQSTLTPDRPLVVATTFYGDLPNNGIAYTDADGTEKQFAVEISGEDGSLGLYAF